MLHLFQFGSLRHRRRLFVVGFLAISSSAFAAAVTYTYDQVGRVTTALYDNNLCIAYSYDANGNRTARVNTVAGPPETAVWGSGVWGCFKWTP